MRRHRRAWILGAACLAVWLEGSFSAQLRYEELSCASFPADLTEANLLDRFGTGNVTRTPVFGADDGPQDGTVIFDGSPRKLEAMWWDPGARTNLAWIRSREITSPWRTSHGIAIGMDLMSIERLNRWPFRLRGLTGPEGLGVIVSWGQGRLSHSGLRGCDVRISLQPLSDVPISPALYRQVSRGRSLSSGHPAMQAINPRVASLTVSHNPTLNRSVP